MSSLTSLETFPSSSPSFMIRVRISGKRKSEMKSDPSTRNSRVKASSSLSCKESEFSKSSYVLPSLLHIALCTFCMLIGLKISWEVDLVNVILPSTDTYSTAVEKVAVPELNYKIADSKALQDQLYRSLLFSEEKAETFPPPDPTNERPLNGTRVGRHGILIRPYPHPDPIRLALAGELLDLIQEDQHRRFSSSASPSISASLSSSQPSSSNPRVIIAVTPTYRRTFQTVHLEGLLGSLKVVRWPLVWVVVEGGGRTNHTADILSQSGLEFVHLEGKEAPRSDSWLERELWEINLRETGLRHIREAQLDGIVIFADDSSMFSSDFFDEAQKVKWYGTASVGVNIHENFHLLPKQEKSIHGENTLSDITVTTRRSLKSLKSQSSSKKVTAVEKSGLKMPVQAPVCDRNRKRIIGWHTYPHLPEDFSNGLPDYASEVVVRPTIWSGFLFNSRLLWDTSRWNSEMDNMVENQRPKWVRRFEDWLESGEEESGKEEMVDKLKRVGDLLQRMLLDESHIQPLGRCGIRVLTWRVWAEARFDSKFYDRWQLPSLEVVVPSKSTPWKERNLPKNTIARKGGLKKQVP